MFQAQTDHKQIQLPFEATAAATGDFFFLLLQESSRASDIIYWNKASASAETRYLGQQTQVCRTHYSLSGLCDSGHDILIKNIYLQK